MTHPPSGAAAPFDTTDDSTSGPPPSPEQARLVAKVRLLMLISGIATVLGIAVVITVIGYRVFHSEGSTAAPEVTALLPKGAKIINTTVSGDRIAVIIDAAGTIEVRTFDLKTLRPAGRLKFAAEP